MNISRILREMTLEEKAQMCSGSDFWKTQDIKRLGIPSVMMCDGPNGLRKQIGEADHLGINESIETVCYPTASAMASSFDTKLIKELGEILGEECQAEQVSMLLGPGVNMKRSPLCGRNFEYFSEDPYLAGEMAAAYIQGLQDKGIAACVKHFAANNQETRRMSGSSQVDERSFHEIYLPAFETAVKKGGARSVMCAYNALNGVFCAENKDLLTGLLRKQWGFDGFVVTDWGAVKDRVAGLKAGVDLEMPGSRNGKTEAIVRAVEDGSLSMEVLDQAVANVLQFVKESLENQRKDVLFDREKALNQSVRFAQESAVLLKNEGALPLNKNARIAFIGEFAQKPRYQGAGSSHINVRHTVGVMECVDGLDIHYARGFTTDETGSEGLLAEGVEMAAQADAAVIFAGIPESDETEGCDRDSLSMPENQNRLIFEVAKVQKNTVVVLHGGAPVELPWIDKVSSVLCMYLAGNGVGRAEKALLFGEANPSGKLAETWPVKVEDNPSWLNFPGEDGIVEYHEGVFIGYRYYDKKKMDVLFPFGHGLSYTTFEYSDLKFDRTDLTDRDSLAVTCKVKNTGTCTGSEVVQLYTGMEGSAVCRPVRELKGFAKVTLEPGEEKEVCFTLESRAFAYYEPKIHNWFTESGTVRIEMGSSDRDIRLSGTVQMHSAMELPYQYTKYSTIGDLFRTRKGKKIFARIIETLGQKMPGAAEQETEKTEKEDALGAGSEKAKQQMMMEMPLNSLVTYGVVREDLLEKWLEELTGE